MERLLLFQWITFYWIRVIYKYFERRPLFLTYLVILYYVDDTWAYVILQLQ